MSESYRTKVEWDLLEARLFKAEAQRAQVQQWLGEAQHQAQDYSTRCERLDDQLAQVMQERDRLVKALAEYESGLLADENRALKAENERLNQLIKYASNPYYD